jgi:heme/copper-type cytochrome/quinol oxidase subunit 3
LLVAYLYLRADQPIEAFRSHTLASLLLPSLNTLVLLASAVVASKALTAIRSGDNENLKSTLMLAFFLGFVFVAGQIIEFQRSGMRPSDPAFGGVFFALIGFHALHVLGGMVFLALNLLRANLNDFNADEHTAVEVGNLFWYYVVAVWAVLFIALYLV